MMEIMFSGFLHNPDVRTNKFIYKILVHKAIINTILERLLQIFVLYFLFHIINLLFNFPNWDS